MDKKLYQGYLDILKEELVPAMGCTEPIALAYAAAKAREILGSMPTSITTYCSGNIIKNVKCVNIPNSGNLRGIEASVVMGALAGDASLEMEVLSRATEAHVAEATKLLEEDYCTVIHLESETPLHIVIEVKDDSHTAVLEIKNSHTNITKIVMDGKVLFSAPVDEDKYLGSFTDRSILNMEDIKVFADIVAMEDVKPILDKQVVCNMNIAEEGLTGNYGVGIGQVLLESYPNDIVVKMKAYTGAGSEARMSGSVMPVVINSGSGNQGLASSVPVIVYAREKGISQEKMYRALVFSNLVTIHQKTSIGRLSAFCGAVSATCASGAAITYLENGTSAQIRQTIINTLANTPGIICDGAKPACAAKIVSSLDGSMMAHFLTMRGKVYEDNTGILQREIEETIACVGYLGKEGMKSTDKTILDIMLGNV